MAFVLHDLVRETTTTTGTGTLSLGGATSGALSFISTVGNGNSTIYGIKTSAGDYEVCYGTVTSGSPNTLSRGTLIASSTGSRLSLPSGTHTVYCTPSAAVHPAVFTPAIVSNELVIDLDSRVNTVHEVTLNANIGAGGISLANVPSAGFVEVVVVFRQSGGPFSVPENAWSGTGLSGNINFDDYYVYQDDTPTVVRFWRTSDSVAWTASGNGPLGDMADGDTLTTGLTFPNTGLHLLDTNASHDLILVPGSDLTADRTLTITTGDASRTLTLTGNASISGTNTGDQTAQAIATAIDADATAEATLKSALGLDTAAYTAATAYLAAATKLDDLGTPDDNTDLNATTARHGLLPKLGGGTTNYLRADGTWAAPAGGGGAGAESGLVITEATTIGGAMSCYFVEASSLG